jgi:hypothetical protein
MKTDQQQQASVDPISSMELRDYFAAMAMAAILSKPSYRARPECLQICEEAYVLADAMLKARTA